MAGVAGKSGRKGFDREQMVRKVLDSADKIVYETLNRMGRYADVDDSVIIELAGRIFAKALPQNIELSSESPIFQLIVNKAMPQNRLTENAV